MSPARLNERLDHLQADHPFLYNLGTGLLIGLGLRLFGFAWIWAIAYALSWALLRAFLWGEGRILRRQYEMRVARVAKQQAAKRQQH